jgi:hypothetical protein
LSGNWNTSEMALRVIRRADDEDSAPAYQASTIVRSRPKATIATTMPIIVSVVRSLWRSALRRTRKGTNTGGAAPVSRRERPSRAG